MYSAIEKSTVSSKSNNPEDSIRTRLFAYGLMHLRAFLSACQRLKRTPLSTLMTCAVIGIAIALPGILFVLWNNARIAGQHLVRDNIQISVYLKQNMTAVNAEQLVKRFKQRADIIKAEIITPEEGIKTFAAHSEFSRVIKTLPNNPLPYVIVITPTGFLKTMPGIKQLLFRLEKIPEVELVQHDMNWMQRFQSLLAVLYDALIISSIVFGVALFLIVGNTVRLATQQARTEITVIKFIGGTDRFIRRPFLYVGALYGCFGGLFGCIFVVLVQQWLGRPIERLIQSYGSYFYLQGLGAEGIAALLVLGLVLGLVAAWISATYHLKTVERVVA